MNFEVKIPLLEANREKPTTDHVLGRFRSYFLEPDPQWEPESEPTPDPVLAEAPAPEGDAPSDSPSFSGYELDSSAEGDDLALDSSPGEEEWSESDDHNEYGDDAHGDPGTYGYDDEGGLPEEEEAPLPHRITSDDDDVVSYGDEQPLFSEERYAHMAHEPLQAEGDERSRAFVSQDTVAEPDPQRYWHDEEPESDESPLAGSYLPSSLNDEGGEPLVDNVPAADATTDASQVDPIRRATISYSASDFWQNDEVEAPLEMEDGTTGLVPTPHDKPKEAYVERTAMMEAPRFEDEEASDRPITVDVPSEAPSRSINSLETDPNLFADAEPVLADAPLHNEDSLIDDEGEADDDGDPYKVQQATKEKKKGGFFSMFRKKK
ncbi:MAG: hypothetical protein KC609_13560 [Myxococcales bacterium]|nr:hypothetical protein [Myxococcales bacterium]